jgi:zinc/manganese transport system permease protein
MERVWWLLPMLLALVVGGLAPLAGTLLLVQRRLFLANLVSHAVLPGLAIALALRLDPGVGGVVSGPVRAVTKRCSTPCWPASSAWGCC